MQLVLGDVDHCNVYLDDVVIYSSTWTEHMVTLHTVFSRLSAASLTFNLKKCEFAKATITAGRWRRGVTSRCESGCHSVLSCSYNLAGVTAISRNGQIL